MIQRLRKLLILLLTAALAALPHAPARAEQPSAPPWESTDSAATRAQRVALLQAEKIAYQDLEGATEQERAAILEARSVIIYSKSWVADGSYASVSHPETGDFYELPPFSDLFPGWDPPINIVEQPRMHGLPAITKSIPFTRSWWSAYTHKIFLENPPPALSGATACL